MATPVSLKFEDGKYYAFWHISKGAYGLTFRVRRDWSLSRCLDHIKEKYLDPFYQRVVSEWNVIRPAREDEIYEWVREHLQHTPENYDLPSGRFKMAMVPSVTGDKVYTMVTYQDGSVEYYEPMNDPFS